MAFLNLFDINYIINNFNKNIKFDISLNTIHSNIIISNDISTSNIYNDLNNQLNNISQKISNIDISLGNNNEKLDEIQLSTIYQDILQFNNSISQINTLIDNNYYNKNYIDNSINYTNTLFDNIINQDISFNGNKTFKDIYLNSDTLYGPNKFYIDPSPDDNTGTLIIKGNLIIDGSMTTINSNEVEIGNKNIILGTDLDNIQQANGIGIEIENNDKSILYYNENNTWNINNDLNLSNNLKVKDNDFIFKINDNTANNKLEIITGNNKNVNIDGNLELSGNTNIISNSISKIPNEFYNINAIDSINTNDLSCNNIVTNNIITNTLDINNLKINYQDLSVNLFKYNGDSSPDLPVGTLYINKFNYLYCKI